MRVSLGIALLAIVVIGIAVALNIGAEWLTAVRSVGAVLILGGLGGAAAVQVLKHRTEP